MVDRTRGKVLFEVGNFVLVVLPSDRFPVGEHNKLIDCNIGPCEVLHKINDNIYRLRIPSHLNTCDVFNVKHLSPWFADSDDDLPGSRMSPSNSGGLIHWEAIQYHFVSIAIS